MGHYFSYGSQPFPFDMFSMSHLVVLLLFLTLLVGLYLGRPRMKQKGKTLIRYILIVILISCEVSFHLWFILHDQWTVRGNLPLQLCSISIYLCTFMLLTRNHSLSEVTFFFGIGGAIQAMITPELFYGFPHYRFFHFFIAHMAILYACFYMIWYERLHLTFQSVIKAWVSLNVIAIFVFFVNHLTGSNYMFLARKPTNPTIIDWLGPYPWYILSLELLAFLIFTIVYFIFGKNRLKLKR
ncbi:TIGR02206 family membrane protein [Alkalihalobacillus sp. LMS39]|uniref:YwaF family protein n=1 Tax=Alkalihalobacillus sp. LMS39 TaxID=2924032 RepID=UPI001FB1B678|nr:TIGR02206 family membrane protein [Alkalihalobacillus sp. LMS39]UOE96010.1 TIGR02206 family membrane protein [Alkalihalobacillus sp. LMS39]